MAFFNKIKNFFTKSEEENASNILSKKTKLNAGLEKTKSSLFEKISRTVVGKSKIDEDDLDDIEEILITSDIGVETTLKIIEKLELRVEKEKYINSDELYNILKNEISSLLISSSNIDNNIDSENNDPYVIMVVGVNGVGKTTTIGKLAYKFKKSGLKVVLGAADTFRAAAIDQLVIWANRVGVEIVKQDMGSDPASVAFDTLQSAKSKNADVVIIDTAGRLHNKVNLMNELSKIKNVMNKVIPNAPHDVILVLDATSGQNVINQVEEFNKIIPITGLIMTKLDGTAKGGILLALAKKYKLPIIALGLGEKEDDLEIFSAEKFAEAFIEIS